MHVPQLISKVFGIKIHVCTRLHKADDTELLVWVWRWKIMTFSSLLTDKHPPTPATDRPGQKWYEVQDESHVLTDRAPSITDYPAWPVNSNGISIETEGWGICSCQHHQLLSICYNMSWTQGILFGRVHLSCKLLEKQIRADYNYGSEIMIINKEMQHLSKAKQNMAPECFRYCFCCDKLH